LNFVIDIDKVLCYEGESEDLDIIGQEYQFIIGVEDAQNDCAKCL
jgi:hypothetical protein